MSDQEPTKKLLSRDEEIIEETLGEIFKNLEAGNSEEQALRAALNESVSQGALDRVVEKSLVEIRDRKAVFTAQGKTWAERIIRRCRLSERLLTDVLAVKSGELSSAACQFEHVLSEEVTDSICTLLGHPRECPHHNLIPPGACCEKAESTVSSVVRPLSKMAAMSEARIAYLHFKNNPDAYRLMSLGLLPGEKIRLLQRVPNLIVEVGEGQVAFDDAVGRDIYVRPI